jgi:anaerobic selenocysteine-containing dehydrogenase
MNSTFPNLPGHRQMESASTASSKCTPTTRQARGIADGDTVDVFNDRGSIA